MDRSFRWTSPTSALPPGDFVRVGGKDVHFTLDFQQAEVHEAMGKMGAGKRVEIPARPLGPSGTDLQRVLALEVYDKFPDILLSTVEYKNTGVAEVAIEKSVNQRRRLNARLGRREGAAVGNVVVSRRELRLGKRRCREGDAGFFSA